MSETTNTHKFLRHRLIGKRFENAAVPLEVMKDLSTLREMIIEAARDEFFKENPNRRRVPRRFMENVELKMTSVEDGSADLGISLVETSPSLLPSLGKIYLEKGRDSIVKTIEAAQRNEKIKDHLSGKVLSNFEHLGDNLREDELIEYGIPSRPEIAPVKFTYESRKRLIQAGLEMQKIKEKTFIRGSVPEVDQDDMQFEVQMFDGNKVKIPIYQEYLDIVLEAFNNYKHRKKIFVQGIGIRNNGKLASFETIEYMKSLAPLDVGARLDEIRSLKDGWLDGDGKAPSKGGLDWLEETLSLNYPDGLKRPYLYPTLEGNISAEWANEKFDISLEIQLATKIGTWYVLNMETDEEEDEEIDLSDHEAWKRIDKRIQKMIVEEK